MLLNERGFSVYMIISILLLFALVFILALPNFFNLDRAKNEEDCINNMKLIWVAASDYMKDNQTSFSGDLNVLRTSFKKINAGSDKQEQVSKNHYLEKIFECPENRGSGAQYIVFSKYLVEDIQGTKKLNYGTIVLCPNLARLPKHFIPSSFYENMEATELQNYFITDMDAISTSAGTDGQRKQDMLLKYINIWKTDPTALTRVRADNAAIRNQVVPAGNPAVSPAS
jgi:hypothetical protein